MTFIDAISATVVLGFFLTGFSQAALPAYRAWERGTAEYRAASSMRFIAESFRNECASPVMNIENWKKAVASVKELESCEISEIRQDGTLRAIRALCVISGERVEIIGVCTP